MRIALLAGVALAALFLLAACGSGKVPAATPTTNAGLACGSERWAVKTLSDPDAARVDLTPVAGSVAALRALPTPADKPQAGRVAPTELTVFRVTADLVEAKLEDDRDFHVVIAEPGDPAQTMIVEFADTDCSGAVGSQEAALMRSARDAFLARYPKPKESDFRDLSGRVVITGVGFFDFAHGQRGLAPNAIELHPVLSIEPAP